MNKSNNYEEIIGELSQQVRHLVSDSEWAATKFELSRGYATYTNRIQNLGLIGNKRVLDAGSGIGNWSVPLASLNEHVVAIDTNSTRLFILENIKSISSIENVDVIYSDFQAIPLDDQTVDAVVCYSALMFADNMNVVLQEFNRVMRTDGKLYVMVDLWHWYFYDYLKEVGYGKFSKLIRLLSRKIYTGKPHFLTRRKMRRLLNRNGFTVISEGRDGKTSFDTQTLSRPITFYPLADRKFSPLFEICALKRVSLN